MKRFYEKVSKGDGCWEWNASLDRHGYGRFWYKGKMIGAHRMAWIIENGKINDDLHVCHKCDNPKCVNPDHLFIGTHKENMDDKYSKGRHLGINLNENNANAKLSREDKENIYERAMSGESMNDLSEEYSVSYATIFRAIASIESGKPVY